MNKVQYVAPSAAISWLILAAMLQFTAIAQQLPTRQQLWQQDLQRQLLASEVTELTTGNGNFLALQRQALTVYTKGTVILVPDWSEHPASPNHLDMLRQQLNEHGWHTLAIMAPDAAIFEQSPAASDYPQQLAERLLAAIRQAELQVGNTVVIANGSSAALLNQLYASEQLVAPAAFIMLGAYLSDHDLNREFAKQIAEQQVPTLDIIHQRDNHFARANLKLRIQLARRNLKTQYRQRQLSGTFYDADVHAWVLKEITGWLHSIGL